MKSLLFIFLLSIGLPFHGMCQSSTKGSASVSKKTIIIEKLSSFEFLPDLRIAVCLDTSKGIYVNDSSFTPKLTRRGKHWSAVIEIADRYKTGTSDKYLPVQRVGLLIDGNGGYISLENLAMVKSDTLRIDKWKIYKKTHTEIIRRSIYYQEMLNDSIVREYSKTDTPVRRPSNKQNISKTGFTVRINKKVYRIIPSIKKDESALSYHGAIPRKTYQEYKDAQANTTKPLLRQYRYTRFRGINKELLSIYYGKIDLINL